MANKILLKIEVLIEKLNLLYEDVTKRGGEFSDVDRELFISYSRELYEITQRLKISDDKFIRTTFQFLADDDAQQAKATPQSAMEKSDIASGSTAKQGLGGIFHSESLSLNEKFKNPVKLLSDTVNDSPIKNLKTYISLNKRFIFISRLFNDNSAEYDRAVDFCNSATSEQDAFRYLNDNFTQKYNWKNEIELVNDLCHFVHRRFL